MSNKRLLTPFQKDINIYLIKPAGNKKVDPDCQLVKRPNCNPSMPNAIADEQKNFKQKKEIKLS